MSDFERRVTVEFGNRKAIVSLSVEHTIGETKLGVVVLVPLAADRFQPLQFVISIDENQRLAALDAFRKGNGNGSHGTGKKETTASQEKPGVLGTGSENAGSNGPSSVDSQKGEIR